jgi:uncharacterized protein (TIGR02001 family)
MSMKKFIIILVGIFVGAGVSINAQIPATSSPKVDISNVSIKTEFALESEAIKRGIQLTDHAFQVGAELQADAFYGGVWTNQPIDTHSNKDEFESEIDLYLAYLWNVDDIWTFDVGFIYYAFPEQGGAGREVEGVDRSREIKIGVIADVLLSPAVYCYYDFDLEQTVVELSGNYKYEIDFCPNSSLQFNGNIGVVQANDIYAGQTSTKKENGYIYWTLMADWMYSLNDKANASIGVRYSGNNDGTSPINGKNHEGNLWWGVALSTAY